MHTYGNYILFCPLSLQFGEALEVDFITHKTISSWAFQLLVWFWIFQQEKIGELFWTTFNNNRSTTKLGTVLT